MRKFVLLAGFLSTLMSAVSAGAPMPRAVVADPPRDPAYPAHIQQLLVPSHGAGMNGLLFVAAGKGPHATVILMLGLPGNERNLDLAQAIRRAGWDVLTFTYRGSWGSPGDFSIASALQDTRAALVFARSAAGAHFGIDPRHIVLAGHSMGGGMASLTAEEAQGLDGLILIDAWNFGAAARKLASGSAADQARARAKFIANSDDFGNALRGANPESLALELRAHAGEWDINRDAGHLRRLPVLTVTARHGLAAANAPTTAALRASGTRVTAVEMDTDHSFSDHRIALAGAVVGWLQRLPRSH